MKIKNSSRITALILTLVMILPLISLPTFAEEAANEYLYFEDFSDATVGVELDSSSGLFGNGQKMSPNTSNNTSVLPKLLKAIKDGDNTVLSMRVNPTASADKYVATTASGKTTGKVSVTKTTQEGTAGVLLNGNFYATTAATGQQYEATFKVDSTTYYLYSEKALEIDVGGDIVDKPIAAANTAISYADYDSIVFEAKYYIPSNFNARIETQLRAYGTGSEATKADWLSLLYIYGDGTKAWVQVSSTIIDTSILLNLGAWNTVSLVYDLDTGVYTAYVNGLKTAVTGTSKTELTVYANSWFYAKVFKDYQAMNSDNVLIDDVCIYEGTEPHTATTDLYYNGFDQCALGNSIPSAYFGNLAAAAADSTHKMTVVPASIVDADGTNALQIFYKNTMNKTREGANFDKNFAVKTPAVSYKEMKSVVFDFDVLIPANSTGMIHVRYGSATASATGSKDGSTVVSADPLTDKAVSWTPELFRLTYTATGTTAHISNEQNNDSTAGAVPVGKWNTLSAVVDLEEATVTIYVNGTKVSTATIRFQYSYTSGKWAILENPSNVTLPAGKLNITGHANARHLESDVQGNILFDNIAMYEGTAPRMQAAEASNYFRYDFENGYALSAGTAGSLLSRTALFASIPSTLQFKTLDENTVLSLAMGADPSKSLEAGTVNYEFVYYGSRLTDISTAYTADNETYYAKGSSNDRAIKFTKNGDGTIKVIGYAWSGDKVNGVDETNKNGKISNLTNTAESVGALTYTDQTATLTIYSSTAALEMFGSGDAPKNIDQQVRMNAATFISGTVVLEAKYYIPTGAKGRSECQDNTSGYKTLYIVDLTNAKIANKTVTRDAWHTVTTVVDVANATADVYVDGVYATTAAMCSKGSFNASKWILAKCMKEDAYIYAGELYIDDIAIEAYEAERALTVAPEASKNFNYATFTFNGVTSDKITATGGKYFNAVGSNAAINYTYCDATAFAGIVDTEAEVQVRLAENSGLRFATKINTELLDALKNDENIKSVMFGTLIAPERYLGEGVELTVESLTAADQKLLQVEPSAIDAFYQGYDNDDATTHYVGSIVDILASNIGENFCARGYVKVELLSGQIVYIYSADYATRNVQEAATAIIAEVGEENLDEVYGVYAQVLRNYAAGLQANPA